MTDCPNGHKRITYRWEGRTQVLYCMDCGREVDRREVVDEEGVSKKTFNFKNDFVSCSHCERCYGCVMGKNGVLQYEIEGKPIRNRCQQFNTEVNPEEIEHNQEVASKCRFWHPEGLKRDVLVYKKEDLNDDPYGHY